MIKEYSLENSKQWDEVVSSFSNYDIYYLSGYVKAFEINGDGKALLIYIENGDTRAINVVIKRDLSECEFFCEEIEKNKYFDFITPYGYGGFIVDGENVSRIISEYEKYCLENNIVCEFVRYHPIIKNYVDMDGFFENIHLGNTVYMDTKDEETIWANLTSKNRNMIRKAEKSGVNVVLRKDRDVIPLFMEIYNATMSKDNAEEYYFFERDFYDTIIDYLSNEAFWLCAEYGGETIAIAIFLHCNGQMHYHLSAIRREYQSLAPTNLILFEAAKWAANNGYKTLHLGGGVGSNEDNLYRFKKAFNRHEDANFYIGKKIYNQELYEYFVELKEKNDRTFDVNTGWFPKYRG